MAISTGTAEEGLGFKDRAPLTAGLQRRKGDFVVQSFAIMLDTIYPRTGYIDVEGEFVAFPISSQGPDDFPGDPALTKDWTAAN